MIRKALPARSIIESTWRSVYLASVHFTFRPPYQEYETVLGRHD